MTTCPYCNNTEYVVKKGFNQRQDGTRHQRYLCRHCHKQFNERTGTPLARLRKPLSQITKALQMRSEGLGVRATGRVEGIAHATVSRWEKRLAAQEPHWSPPAIKEGEVIVEGDELYTRVNKNHPSSKAKDGH